MATNCNSEAGDIQAKFYFERVTYEIGTDWNGGIKLNVKYI
jgi:hypothetical protein